MVGVRKVGFRLGLLIPVLISISFVFSFSSCTFDFVVGPKSTEFSVEVHHASFSVELGLTGRMWMDKFLGLITVMGKVVPFLD